MLSADQLYDRLMGRLGCDKDDGTIREYFESGMGHDALRLGGMHRLILEHGIARCGRPAPCPTSA